MRVSLNTFTKVIVISTFIYIFGWNFFSLKEGLSEDDQVAPDEEAEIVDAKTGLKRKMTRREKREVEEKREEERKRNDEDMDERIKSFKR